MKFPRRGLRQGRLAQGLLHRDEVKGNPTGIIDDGIASAKTGSTIKFHTRQRGHQLERFKAIALRCRFAASEQRSRNSAAGIVRMNEESADFCGFRPWIDQLRITISK